MPKKVYPKPTATPTVIELAPMRALSPGDSSPATPFSPREGRETEMAAALRARTATNDNLSTTTIPAATHEGAAAAPIPDSESVPPPPETGLGVRAGTFVFTEQPENETTPTASEDTRPPSTPANETFEEIDLGPHATLTGALPSAFAIE